jgi:hypothetical protein
MDSDDLICATCTPDMSSTNISGKQVRYQTNWSVSFLVLDCLASWWIGSVGPGHFGQMGGGGVTIRVQQTLLIVLNVGLPISIVVDTIKSGLYKGINCVLL